MAVANQPLIDSVLVLVAGTGSIAMSYQRQGGAFERTGRIGGWGQLLGDDGSGYSLGREALRVALASSDTIRLRKQAGKKSEPTNELSERIFDHFAAKYPDFQKTDLLSSILVPNADSHRGTEVATATAKRIADIAPVLLQTSESSIVAKEILERGAQSLVRLVMSLLSEQNIDPSGTALILAGGLMQNEPYRRMVTRILSSQGVDFSYVETVEQPALVAAKSLLAADLV